MSKKAVIFMILLVSLLAQGVMSANVGFAGTINGKNVQTCVYVSSSATVKDVLQEVEFERNTIQAIYSVDDITEVNGTTNSGNYSWKVYTNSQSSSYLNLTSLSSSIRSSSAIVVLDYNNYTNGSQTPSMVSYANICPNQLEINDIEAEYDGEDESLSITRDRIKDVPPGATLDITFEFENKYDEDDDEDEDNLIIEDIEIEGVIEDIDDGDEIEAYAELDELEAEDDDKVTLTFDIPELVNEGKYDLIITITAEDGYGLVYEYELEYEVEIEKEKYLIKFDEAELTQETISCSRNTALNVLLKNYGSKEHDEAELTVKSSALEIDKKIDEIELESDVFDSDSEYSNTFSFNIPEDVTPGTYNILLEALCDRSKCSASETLTLKIEECEQNIPDQSDDQQTDQTKDEQQDTTQNGGIVIRKPSTDTQTDVTMPTVQKPEPKGFWEKNGMIIGIILAQVVIIGGALAVLLAVLKKK